MDAGYGVRTRAWARWRGASVRALQSSNTRSCLLPPPGDVWYNTEVV
ncbi:MAG: hypothetical protein KatS3mg058_4525 [Roseiflexus sp.]|nr:MAG: hypothetical protein KatS3mg058_4525 [Roseiflexus sp.]